jgi:DNA topoisomerase-1
MSTPAKRAKNNRKFLGSDYQVESSYGHIADLPSKEIGVDEVVLNQNTKFLQTKALVTKLKGLAKKLKWFGSK